MSKYLFTDETGGVREVQSQEELQVLIESATQPDKIRIWIYNSNEWLGFAAFHKRFPFAVKKEIAVAPAIIPAVPLRSGNGKKWLKKFLFITGTAAGAFLIFNFTKIKWTKATPVNTSAVRPANVPVMDIDSLIMAIEEDRDMPLDRSTRTNLRLRNTWPDRIDLRLNAERETSNAGSRYSNIDISIDNTTGFNLDEAVIKLNIWKNKKISNYDTLKFDNIRYDKISIRQLTDSYRGDSISVSFDLIKAKAFNFYYSAAVKNNSGNYNDKWFWKEAGNIAE